MTTLQIRHRLAANAFADALRRFTLLVKYAEDQPRVPAGSPDGGQWTSGGGAVNLPPALFAGTDMYGPAWDCEFVSTYVLRCRDGFGNPDYDIDFSGHGGVHYHLWNWKNGELRRQKGKLF